MVKDSQVRRLFECLERGMSVEVSALKAGMSEKTARKYQARWRLPSEIKRDHSWRTRKDPFDGVWSELKQKLEVSPNLQAKTLFEWLCERYPGVFMSGQRRTLERRVRQWRALEGPAKEVFFPQLHHPGKLSQSDFTHMTELAVTISGELFRHMLFHFVLTYSNWEHVSICYSESFESLSEGLQQAFFSLGGVAAEHQTDRLTAAVNKEANPEEFTTAYKALLAHYQVAGRKIQARKSNQNGDVEQSHNQLKIAVDQALLLRGSRNFDTVKDYQQFLYKLVDKRNALRSEKINQETVCLKPLPQIKLDTTKNLRIRVSRNSLIFVQHNTYSVHSRLIGEMVDVKIYSQRLEVWFGQKCVEILQRLRGTKKSSIQYHHIIDWLIRKPGAFENYLYKQDLFPSSSFRMAYDLIAEKYPSKASKLYLKILELAAKQSESKVETALKIIIQKGQTPCADSIAQSLCSETIARNTEITVLPVDLFQYDQLLVTSKDKDYEQKQHEICTFTESQRIAPVHHQAVL